VQRTRALIRPRDRAPVDPRIDRSKRAALEGALAVLLEEGWDAVTHLRVAERSGVGRTTLYRHWPDRTVLLRDTLLLYGVAADIPLSGDLREDLVTIVDASRVQLAKDEMLRMLTTLFERAACAPTPDFAIVLRDLLQRHTETLRTLLTGAARAGELQADLDVEEGIVTLLAPLTYRRVAAGTHSTRAHVERSVDDFLAVNR
jgi:AcrR family transcriptional regulator